MDEIADIRDGFGNIMTRNDDRNNDDRNDETSRRTFLRATAGAVAFGGVAGAVGAQQEGPQLIVLDGITAGWEGVAPASIEGETNPTLPLVPEQDYRIRWTNVDGQPHNVVMLDADDNHIVGTDVIGSQGATQTLEFTANENMAEYYCEVHPSTMRGGVELVQEPQLEPVNETADQTTTPANQTADGGANDTDAEDTGATGTDAQGPLGIGNNTENVSQNDTVPQNVQEFRSSREQVFNQTGNGTVRGNLTTGGTNATGTETITAMETETTTPAGNGTNGSENGTQEGRMDGVSAQDVQRAARVPGFDVLTALGGLLGGTALLSKRSDD